MQAALLAGGPEHQAVALHQRIQAVVAAAEHRGHRDAAPQAGIKHQAVTVEQARAAQAQAAEPILPVRINAGVVEHQIRTHLIEQVRNWIADGEQVGVVLQPVGEADVEIAALLVQGEVVKLFKE